MGLGKGQRILRRQDLRLDLEEGEQVIEIERLARRGGEARQQPFEKIAQAPERAREEREIADRELAGQRAPRDVGIGQVVADGADRGEQAAPAGAPHAPACDWPHRRRWPGVTIAIDQEAVEAEDLHFLGGLDAGRGLPHVVDLAPLRRAAEIERIALRVEMRLAEEGRHQRQKKQERSATAHRGSGRRRSLPPSRCPAPGRTSAPSASSARWSGGARARAGPGTRRLRNLPGRALPHAPSGGRSRHWSPVPKAGCR